MIKYLIYFAVLTGVCLACWLYYKLWIWGNQLTEEGENEQKTKPQKN